MRNHQKSKRIEEQRKKNSSAGIPMNFLNGIFVFFTRAEFIVNFFLLLFDKKSEVFSYQSAKQNCERYR